MTVAHPGIAVFSKTGLWVIPQSFPGTARLLNEVRKVAELFHHNAFDMKYTGGLLDVVLQ